MGTRSLTFFIDPSYPDEPTACMYRQMDGYPSGHGLELAEFLKGITIVNGYTTDKHVAGTHANGVGCLAAQAVAHFKNDQGIGGIYLEPTTRVGKWEDYIYKVFANDTAQIRVEVYRVRGPDHELLFSGIPTEMLAWIKNQEQEN